MDRNILSDLVITRVCSVITMYTAADTGARRSSRPRWAIVVKQEGETEYLWEGMRYLSDAGHFVILPKGCSYEWKCTKAGHCSIMEFDSDLTCDRPLSIPVKNSEGLINRIKKLEYKMALKGGSCHLESMRDIYEIMADLLKPEQEVYVPGGRREKIAVAVEYMLENYDRNVTNDELAELTGFSTVYFRKLFTGIYGVSPIHFIRRLRIKRAKEILKSDFGSVGETAAALGYKSIYDFSRDFKNHTGMSPTEFSRRT